MLKKGDWCKHFKGMNVSEKNIYEIIEMGAKYSGEASEKTIENLVVYKNIFQDKIFVREYEDLIAELSPEKQELYGQKYRVQKLTTEEIELVKKEIETKKEMKIIGKKYFEQLDEILKQYFSILSDEIPEFFYEYVGTPEMQKQGRISCTCGTCYTNLFDMPLPYSSLDHSVAVALIIWNFTKDKKQTLSGLLHDIATPAFKHCIDFMNGDHENQESTEELTAKIISSSKEIMSLLSRDGIKLEEVADYHIYPIADNDTPKLAADRLEYTFSNGLGVRTKVWDLKEVKEIYNNIEVQTNEEGIEELGFKDKQIAEKFVNVVSKLSAFYISNPTTFSMQFIADIMKKMSENKLVSKDDLYNLSEKEIIDKIENCKIGQIAECFKNWRESIQLFESDEFVEGVYCIKGKNKKRYIVPLVKSENGYKRINDVSETAKQDVEAFLNYKPKTYCYLKIDKNFGI
jgi:hypothetical protein